MHNHTAAIPEVALASLFNIRAEAILPPCFVVLQKLELSLFFMLATSMVWLSGLTQSHYALKRPF